MDEMLMLEWIEKVLNPATQDNCLSFLILDECCSHLTVKIFEELFSWVRLSLKGI
jgi:hypothetical protein